jgi:hypothetical protein
LATDDPLWAAIRAAHQRWSPDTAERFPPPPEWEPPEVVVGTGNSEADQELTNPVPTVPTVPTVQEEFRRQTRAERLAEERAAWEERAAVLEFEGGLDRAAAEQLAAEELGYLQPSHPPKRRRY